MRIALFPGTFDPLTLGHRDIIFRAARIFDKLFVGIGSNQGKQAMFSAAQRKTWIERICAAHPHIETIIYEGLTVDCCKRIGARFIVRGIRYISDFDYERSIADVNRSMDPTLETVILTCRPPYHFITSTIVRDILAHKGDPAPFIPEEILQDL